MTAVWTRVTASQVISKVKSLLRAVILTSNGESNNAAVTLYNGESTVDPQITVIRSGTGRTEEVTFDTPFICDRGIYVVLGSHADECLVLWEPCKS